MMTTGYKIFKFNIPIANLVDICRCCILFCVFHKYYQKKNTYVILYVVHDI